MTGAAIEYLLGLFFAISAVDFSGSQFSANAFRLIAGIVLIIMAIVHIAPAL